MECKIPRITLSTRGCPPPTEKSSWELLDSSRILLHPSLCLLRLKFAEDLQMVPGDSGTVTVTYLLNIPEGEEGLSMAAAEASVQCTGSVGMGRCL